MTDKSEFQPAGPNQTPQSQTVELQLEIWKKAVDTQMHFNEMCVKSRQLGMTFVVAAIGLAVVLLSQGISFSIPFGLGEYEFQIHVSSVIVLVAAGGVFAVSRLDLGVYHRMLRGAVTFGMEFEDQVIRPKLMKTQLGMTEFITLFSRHHEVREENGSWVGMDKEDAEKKLRKFYRFVIIVLLLISGAIAIFAGETGPAKSEAQPNSVSDKART